MFRLSSNKLSYIKSNHSNYFFNPIRSISTKNKETVSFSILKEMYHMCRPEKKGYIYLILFTGITAGINMLFPAALSDIQYLASLRYPQENKDVEEINFQKNTPPKITQPENENNKQSSNNSLDSLSIGRNGMLEKIFGKKIVDKNNLTNKQVTSEYQRYLGFWIPIFSFCVYCTYKRRLMTRNIGEKIAIRLRHKVFSTILYKDMTFFVNPHTNVAGLIQTLNNDIYLATMSLSYTVVLGVRSSLFFAGGTALIILHQPVFGFSAAVFGLFFWLFSTAISQRLRESTFNQNESLRLLSEIANERFTNIKAVKILHSEDLDIMIFRKQLMKFFSHSYQVSKYEAINIGFYEGFMQVAGLGILAVGSYFISAGAMSGDTIAFSLYLFYIAFGARGFSACVAEIKKASGYYDKIYEIIGTLKGDPLFEPKNQLFNFDLSKTNTGLERDFFYHSPQTIEVVKQFEAMTLEEINNAAQKITVLQKKNNASPPSIEFKNVSFSYNPKNSVSYIFQQFSCKFDAGKTYGIIGSSGTGKTTLLNLLVGLYDVESGEILIDGQNIKNFSKKERQQLLGFVTQEPLLFMGTILDNILIGNEDPITMEQVIAVCKKVKAHDFIMKLDKGYLTQIGERGNIMSGGQKQRLILARVLLRNPKILILDEATSAVDDINEREIIEDLKEVVEGCTCLIITHKMKNFKDIINGSVNLGSPNQSINQIILQFNIVSKSKIQ